MSGTMERPSTPFEDRYKKQLPASTNAQEAAVRVYNSGGILRRSDPFVGPKDRFGNSFRPTQYADPSQSQPQQPAPQVTKLEPPPIRMKRNEKETIAAFRKKVLERGGSAGIQSLGRVFRLMDCDDNRRLNQQELQQGLEHFGLYMKMDEVATLVEALDKDGSKSIRFDEFLLALKGTMNQRRLKMIDMAYKVLDKNGNGAITIEDIQNAYVVDYDPDVLAERLHRDRAMENFLAQFDTIETDGVVTEKEFAEYYRNISASIDNDDYFELMIRNAWHIPGGEGWCENTSNVRLLVVSENNDQKVVMIENDLGLDLHDRDAVLAALKAQGITNVYKYTLSGTI